MIFFLKVRKKFKSIKAKINQKLKLNKLKYLFEITLFKSNTKVKSKGTESFHF